MLRDKHGHILDSPRIQAIRRRANETLHPSAIDSERVCAADGGTDSNFYVDDGDEVCCWCRGDRKAHFRRVK